MIFERKKYLDELIAGRGNGLVKIITGVRRCGKSFLLFDIWHNWLLKHGVTRYAFGLLPLMNISMV